ncbi:SIR2 family NAD-dependent protein deacylase [Vibrio alginolyticus]|uniref:SIR2 family NAD-dependent protein deacylase n=1 Tax=Vibrio alginolyticus TaxID=663 RepID=UPI001EED61B8|nr:SIR2 family protein [Vibrio alginolyticus]
MSCIEQLSEDAKQSLFASVFTENYFFWVGSGFSYNFGYGSWGDVLVEISKKIEYPLVLDLSNPLKAAELLFSFARNHHNYSEYEFNSLVSEALLDLKKEVADPSWVRRFRVLAPNMIVTTNWDNLLESIFDGLANVVVRKDSCPKVASNGKNIFKIHGDLGRPDSIVVTQSQYFSFQREDTYLNRKIYTLFSEASPIFIGYSLTDPNIGFLYDEVYADLGEEKPPAFMIVHPSVSDNVLEESRLLFQDKNIFIIKAEIGEFLEDLAKEYTEYKKSNKRFLIQYKNIEGRLRELSTKIVENKPIKDEDILNSFNNKESRDQAISALVEILSYPVLYKEFGGELLQPENRMSYREVDQFIQAVVTISNKSRYPSDEVRDQFHMSVLKACSKTDGVWDFYTASKPFMNVLRISPFPNSPVFEPRILHVIDILRWSAPSERGKCWSTWRTFCDYLEWLSTSDIDAMLKHLEANDQLNMRASDVRWLEKLKTSTHCNEALKLRIDELIKT